MAPVSYLLGARVLEKHFTLNRTWKGTDHAFSLAPAGFKRMIRDLRRTRLALGDGVKRTHETEHAPIIKMSKKLVAKQDIPAGHQLSIEDIAFKSPGDGMHPYELTDVIGRTTTRAISQHQPLAPDAFA